MHDSVVDLAVSASDCQFRGLEFDSRVGFLLGFPYRKLLKAAQSMEDRGVFCSCLGEHINSSVSVVINTYDNCY